MNKVQETMKICNITDNVTKIRYKIIYRRSADRYEIWTQYYDEFRKLHRRRIRFREAVAVEKDIDKTIAYVNDYLVAKHVNIYAADDYTPVESGDNKSFYSPKENNLSKQEKEINDDEDEKLVSELKRAQSLNVQDNFQYCGKPKDKSEAFYVSGHKTYSRDRQVAINALAHANYSCEIDNNHSTFIRRNSDKPYTEPHHLIPMAFSDDFNVSLDVEENIVSLCSNCHNEIHYGRDLEKLIERLYTDRKEDLKNVGLDISLKRLLAMYSIYFDQNDN